MYISNLVETTKKNGYYRNVIYTNSDFQLVTMSLNPKVEIGMEIHHHTTQFVKVVSGRGLAIIQEKNGNSTHYPLYSNSMVIIPPNTHHNIVNTSSKKELKLYTIYTPKEHTPNLKQRNKPTPIER